MEDQPALLPKIFDPDQILSTALLSRLASATSTTSTELCQPFVRSGFIVLPDNQPPVPFTTGLLDTGAQGSNFVSRQLLQRLPASVTKLTRHTDRVVRLGDSRSLSINLELILTVAIADSTGQTHEHSLWYSVLDVLSHDLIIGLVDLIGPYYDLFADSVLSSRHLAVATDLSNHLSSLTATVATLATTNNSIDILRNARYLHDEQHSYSQRKRAICHNATSSIDLLALQDGSYIETLSHPHHGTVFADNRVESRYNLLTSMLLRPSAGAIIPPWSKPIDALAPEETDTPDPTSFPDDILMYLSTSHDEALHLYREDLKSHITDEMLTSCPEIMTLLTSDLAYDVFVPSHWTGIDMEPYHLEVKPGLPDHLKARSRPIRESLYQDAKTEFDRMSSYFYEKSTSTIASPLVVAPKATAPFIRLCGDYRPINPYVCIPQEPIPHVQQTLAKAAGWKIFVDLDMTNSFHQIPIDLHSSNLLSVATPWGLFRPKFLPEGVGPASGILQSIVRRVFADLDDWIIVIFDNFLILASDYPDALTKLRTVLARCHKNRLVLKMKKSWIGTTIVTFFGYEVQPGSWGLSQSRRDAITAMIFPTSTKLMQSFLGAANFFHTHIPNYATWASSLYECTTAAFNWDPTTWTKDYKAIFEIFKTAIKDSATLHFPDYSLPWVIRSDSSDYAVGAVLFQLYTSSTGTTSHQAIAFASKKYSGAAINWDTYKQEAYALYFAVVQFSYYLRGKEFVLETDHRNLVWIESSQVPIIVRWRVLLQSYVFQVRHIPGTENTVADWLSRMYPITSPIVQSLVSMSLSSAPTLMQMFNSVHGHRSLHHGAKKTYLSLCTRYPGHGISLRVIQDLVAECPICQKDRIPLRTIPYPTSPQTLLHHVRSIGIDHVSVTPADEDGYIGLLLIVEHDTKFPFAYAIRDYTATTVATILFKHYCTFGTFTSIYSDPGSALMSHVVRDLNLWLGIPHHVSLIGRHESNGTEHVNAIFLGHLRRLVHDERLVHRWASDTVLPLINHALATSPNTELGGLSPAELKFGTRDFPRFNLPQPLTPGSNYCELVQQLDNNLAIVRSVTDTHQATLRDARLSKTPHNHYQPGDFILWNPREHSHSFRTSKLAPKLLGPYIVQSQKVNDIACQHTTLGTQHVFHSDRVTPFLGSPDSITTLGNLDRDEYIVASILAHRGNWKRLHTMEFLVHWDGYDSDLDSWEPWRILRSVIALHAYLRHHGLDKHIPSQYR